MRANTREVGPLAIAANASASYPVNIHVEPQTEPRNKMTVAFRIILAIPHWLLVGGIFGAGAIFARGQWWGGISSNGVLGAVATVCAIISWFAILFANQHPEGLRNLCTFYLRWKVRAVAYMALFRDDYPPFGDADYPATLDLTMAEFPRDKMSVALRIIYIIPHAVVLFFLGIAWFFTSIVAWIAILVSGEYPQGLYNFGLGVFRWSTRVEAYFLLLTDQYPPFSLE